MISKIIPVKTLGLNQLKHFSKLNRTSLMMRNLVFFFLF